MICPCSCRSTFVTALLKLLYVAHEVTSGGSAFQQYAEAALKDDRNMDFENLSRLSFLVSSRVVVYVVSKLESVV